MTYAKRELDPVDASGATSLLEPLRQEVASLLDLDPRELDPHRSLIEYGLESIKLMRLQTRMAARGIKLPSLARLLEAPTLQDWAAQARPGKPRAQLAPVAKSEPDAAFALTPIQQAYWIGRQDDQHLGGVGCHLYAEFDGQAVDAPRLEQAMFQLLQRHPMLRARFLPSGEQQILPRSPWAALQRHDWRDAAPAQAEAGLLALRERLSHRRLRVEEGEVCDVQLSLLGEGRSRIHLNLDLLVADVLSFEIFLHDLAMFYVGRGGELPALSTGFADYLATQTQQRAASLAASQDYWRQRIADLPGGPALPLARQPEQLTRTRFSRRAFTLDLASLAALQTRARDAGLTVASVLASAFAQVLGRWSSDGHFVLNLPLFDRQEQAPDVAHMIADFTNLTLLEVDVSQPLSFVEQTRRLQRQLHDDLQHNAWSGLEVLREMAHETRRSAPVVFACNLDKPMPAPLFRQELGDLGWSVSQTPQVWLDHQTYPLADGLMLNWDAVDELFPAGLLDEMFGCYRQAIEWLCTQDWQQSLPLPLPPRQQQEREQVNATAGELPEGVLYQPWLRWVEETPQAPALLSDSVCLSHAELFEVAAHIASHLVEAGVVPGDRVMVCLEKGPVQIAATLAVLLAGGVYVPVAADGPLERLRLIHQDCAARAVLVERGGAERDWPFATLAVDLATRAAQGLSPEVGMGRNEELAYIIYTSGSTGLPKGVMIDHRGALNTVLDINRRWQVDARDRIFGLSSLSFDLSVYDIFGALAAGAALVLPAADSLREPRHWLASLQRHDVSVWNSVPALFDMLLTELQGQGARLPQSLRLAMLSGDWVPLDLPARARACGPQLTLVALGGATEASIWSNWFEVGQVDPCWASIPYGYPLTNQYYRVLDSQGRDCPEGVKGDLYIGGIGVALGYWNNPERTAAQFSLDPQTGARFYRTGDLARYTAGARLEFLGRKDFQVKIKGHRIELGEIESVLARQPGIRGTAVDVQEDSAGSRQLVAYVTLDPAQRHDPLNPVGCRQEPPADVEERWQATVEAGRDEVQQALVDLDLPRFNAFWRDIERLAALGMAKTLAEAGLFTEEGMTHDKAQVMQRLQALPRYAKLVGQWLQTLADDGFLQAGDGDSYTARRGLGAEAFEAAWQALSDIGMLGDHAEQVLAYIRRSIDGHLALFRGTLDPLEIYFPEGSTRVAEGIYRFNPVNAFLNRVAAQLVGHLAANRQGTLNVLEVGAGTGGTSESLFAALEGHDVRYRFTDLSDFFLERARQRFARWDFIDYGHFDINDEPEPQGVRLGSQDLVVAVNVLHDARNLANTLASLRQILRPGGQLLVIEATQNCRLQMVSIGFIEGMSDYDDWRVENNLPFLSLPQWEAELRGSGFARQQVFPEPGSEAAVIAQHVLLAQNLEPAVRLDAERLRRHLAGHLPEYMLPAHWVTLQRLPLSGNGKVDRGRLPALKLGDKVGSDDYEPAHPGLETQVAALWAQLLKRDKVGRRSDFFALGGDSLLATRLMALLRQQLACEVHLRDLFQHPRLQDFVAWLGQPKAEQPLVMLNRPVGGVNVVCLPTADGECESYRQLAVRLDGQLSLVGLRDPQGRCGSELPAALHGFIETLKALPGPVLLLGWSVAAKLATALAGEMERRGQPVAGLMLLDPLSTRCFEQDGVLQPARFFGLPPVPAGDLYLQARQAGRIPHGLEPDAFQALLQRCRNLHAGLAGYPTPRLAAPVRVLQSAASAECWSEPLHDWQDLLEQAPAPQTLWTLHWELLSDQESLAVIAETLLGLTRD
ncbi:amino acid adenylation enzyme/thioester reductase family protein [Pseudomonas asplenii]|uniref:Amino acid adenylation enzyme/thioester reductase family protein n=4 Tax=Pseudomonas asplenii TaxID=53407 RepID=A0A0N0VIF3_9PSED|nr:non-ribosomal peptide synthetase [Pseudomonas fuscovaginae]KPA87543.1 amino acid adenylation enzyme/thioester reductase family protein [Pseudomonas fuscovaginae]